MAEPVQRPDNTVPTFTAADKMDGRTNEDVHLRGHGELRRNGTVVKGDTLDYNQDTDVATATGNVRITYPDRRMVATSRQAQYYSKEGRLVLTGDVDVIDEDGQIPMALAVADLVDARCA